MASIASRLIPLTTRSHPALIPLRLPASDCLLGHDPHLDIPAAILTSSRDGWPAGARAAAPDRSETGRRGREGGLGQVIVVGSVNVEYAVGVASLPRPGETVTGGRLQILPGGKGAN